MKGIEILDVTYKSIIPDWCYMILCFLIIISFVIMIGAISNNKETLFYIMGIILIIAIFIFIILTVIGCNVYTKEIDTYKITINNEVEFNKFNQKYKIIEQEGKIYTVKERNKNE